MLSPCRAMLAPRRAALTPCRAILTPAVPCRADPLPCRAARSIPLSPAVSHALARQYLHHYAYAHTLAAFDEAAGTGPAGRACRG
jgi:hypothetical protein